MPDTIELTAPPEPAVITIDGPNDWLAAAAAHRVRYPRSPFGEHEHRQLRRTLAYLADRDGDVTPREVTVYRAAKILRAGIDAPRSVRLLGIDLKDPVYNPDTAAAVIPLEPTAVIKPVRKRKPRSRPRAKEADAADTAAPAPAPADVTAGDGT
jgi:hypothetical protein